MFTSSPVLLPEMFFGHNRLELRKGSVEIVFNANDAITKVQDLNVKVACSEDWIKQRAHVKQITKVKNNNWTFYTTYDGTTNALAEKSDKSIPFEKLLIKEPILFFDENILFEDELSDHGTASLSVKIRVMHSSFFVLLRYFLRIDNVMFAIHDTRLYHEFGTNYALREFTRKEALAEEIMSENVSLFTDAGWVAEQIKSVKEAKVEKLNV